MNDWMDGAKEASEAEKDASEQEYAPTWKPAEGDMLAGTVVKGDYVLTTNGEAHLLVVKDEETGQEYTVWCSSFLLKQFVIDKAPAQGSMIVIQFHGKRPSKKDKSRSFNHYSMQVEHEDFDYWHKIMQRFNAKRAASLADGGFESSSSSGPDGQTYGPNEAPF